MSEKKNYTIEAVGRALSVMEALAERPDQGVTELSKTLGLTKSIVFRLLYTLEDRGFVFRDPDRASYSLGYRVAVLGERVGREGSLMHAAPTEMDKLRDLTGENVNLVMRDGLRSQVLATRQGTFPIRIFAEAGRYGPLHAGGASLLMLAYSSEEVIDRVLSGVLEKFSHHTETDPENLRAMIERIREAGYHVAVNDLDDGAFSIAAPIRDAKGHVIAGISVAGAMARLNEATRAQYLTAVKSSADAISAKLSLTPNKE